MGTGNHVWDDLYGIADGCSIKENSDGSIIVSSSTSAYGNGALDIYLVKIQPE